MPMFVQQEDLEGLDDEDDDEEGRKGKKGVPNPGRRKIEIEYIEDKVRSRKQPCTAGGCSPSSILTRTSNNSRASVTLLSASEKQA